MRVVVQWFLQRAGACGLQGGRDVDELRGGEWWSGFAAFWGSGLAFGEAGARARASRGLIVMGLAVALRVRCASSRRADAGFLAGHVRAAGEMAERAWAWQGSGRGASAGVV